MTPKGDANSEFLGIFLKNNPSADDDSGGHVLRKNGNSATGKFDWARAVVIVFYVFVVVSDMLNLSILLDFKVYLILTSWQA